MQSTMYFKCLWCQPSFVFGGIYLYLSLIHTIPVMHLQSGWGIPKAETKEKKTGSYNTGKLQNTGKYTNFTKITYMF